MILKSVIQRVIAHSVFDRVSGCWIWTGAYVVNKNGLKYGRIKVDGRAMLVHRAAWEAVHGRAMPRSRAGAHQCANTLCCNPAHVRAQTQSRNVADAWRLRKERENRKVAYAEA